MRPASRTRIALAACAVPALLIGVSACGTAETTQVAAHPAAQASSRAAWDEKTLVPAMQAALEKQKSVHVTLRAVDANGNPLRAQGDLARHGKQHDMVLTMERTPFGGAAEVRVVDGVMYLSVPPMTPEGKFVAIRPGDKSSPLGSMMPREMRGVSPDQMFAAFESGLRKVAFLGEDTVQGRQLGHYRLTVDPRAVAKDHHLPRAGVPHMGGMPESGRVPRTVTFDIWLDSGALVHRVELHKAQQGSLEVDLSHWGEPVTVQAPPKADIVQGSGSLPGLSGSSRS